MKKWQEWTIAVVIIVLVVGAIGGAYWYLTDKDDATEEPTEVAQTQEQKELAEVDTELKGIDDLDLSALDTIEKDLQAIDLSSL